MPTQVRSIIDRSNPALMNAIRHDSGSLYQSRITEATQANMKDTLQQIMGNPATRNLFMDALVNRIGSVIIRNKMWTNPMAEFKRGFMDYGDTIQETSTGLLDSKEYSEDRNYLERDIYGVEVPYAESNFHTVNRKEWYKLSIRENALKRAFLSPEGLYEFIDELMSVAYTSDNLDEFLLMTELIPQYEKNGGFHRINVPDARSYESGSAEAKMAIRKIRAMAENLTFLSTKYNAAGMPSSANREDLVLIGTPEFYAATDVEALAGAFNVERLSLTGRQITIPYENFGISGAQAMLTTRDFWVVADTLLENRSGSNPVGLGENYFLHHHQIVSNSRFVPAVLFHTGADDSEPIVINPATGISQITVTDRAGETVSASTPVARGSVLIASAHATASEGNPDTRAVRWEITGAVDPRTRITQQGTVHIGGRESSTNLQVKATTVWTNPVDVHDTQTFERTRGITVDADSASSPVWPRDERPGDGSGNGGEEEPPGDGGEE